MRKQVSDPARLRTKRAEGIIGLRPGVIRRCIAETPKIAHWLREGWFLPTGTHRVVLTILRPSAERRKPNHIAGLTVTWNPENSGPGDLTDFDFEPEWTDCFPDAMG